MNDEHCPRCGLKLDELPDYMPPLVLPTWHTSGEVYPDELPAVGCTVTWTKGWKPAVDVTLWKLHLQVGWFQP